MDRIEGFYHFQVDALWLRRCAIKSLTMSLLAVHVHILSFRVALLGHASHVIISLRFNHEAVIHYRYLFAGLSVMFASV
jgi:hypothetical protein